jgi:hypothetical protein
MNILIPSILVAVAVAAQSPASMDAERDRAEQNKIAALCKDLLFDVDDPSEVARRSAALDSATKTVHQEIDRYVSMEFRAEHGSERSQARLRGLLSAHVPNAEYSDEPFVRVAQLRGGLSLVAAYTLVRGHHHDISTIRGFRMDGTRLRVVATAGGEFKGYGMFKAQIPSPIGGELWFLAWGQDLTFNGKKVRFRLYAFDGETFRTVWQPDDMYDATMTPTQNGFVVSHTMPGTREPLDDLFVITADGPVRQRD